MAVANRKAKRECGNSVDIISIIHELLHRIPQNYHLTVSSIICGTQFTKLIQYQSVEKMKAVYPYCTLCLNPQFLLFLHFCKNTDE